MTTSTILVTSLAQIRYFQPCVCGWRDVLAANSQRDMQESFPLKNTVQSNTFSDVCWLLGNLEMASICVKVAQMCADSVSYLNNNYAANANAAASAAANASAASAAANAAFAAANAASAVADFAYDAFAYASVVTANAAYASANAFANAAEKEQMLKNKAFLLLAIELYEQGVLS